MKLIYIINLDIRTGLGVNNFISHCFMSTRQRRIDYRTTLFLILFVVVDLILVIILAFNVTRGSLEASGCFSGTSAFQVDESILNRCQVCLPLQFKSIFGQFFLLLHHELLLQRITNFLPELSPLIDVKAPVPNCVVPVTVD